MNTVDVAFPGTQVPLLEGLSEARLQELAKGSRTETYEAGELVVAAGAEVHALGIVLEGTLAAAAGPAGDAVEPLGEFHRGDTFGEIALMTGDHALADLTAVTRCRILFVPLTPLRAVLMADPEIVQRISRTVSERFMHLLRDPRKAAAVGRTGDAAELLELDGERPECILVINCGSSSVKYSFSDTAHPERTARGQVERIGMAGTRLTQRGPRGEIARELPPGGHPAAFAALLDALTDSNNGVVADAAAISVVGHRVVHGGERFTAPVVIDDAVLAEIEALAPLAPLHNPVNVAGIRAARRIFPAVPQVAVFDTAFHATLPPQAYLYGLPYEFYADHGVRRYGFHGMSHAYVSRAAAQFLGRRLHELEIISCHLGNGTSLCAIEHGRSIDTSMGFTPGEGLIMGTRCGDIDAGVGPFLARAGVLDAVGWEDLLNKRSGLLGLSGVSGDMREVEAAAAGGNPRALLALKAFCYRVRKYIGAYLAALGGLDVLIFTGGIAGTPGCTLEGPAGGVTINQGVICALRHIHMTPADALRYGVRDQATVRVRVPGDREMVFGDVLIRVHENFALAMHIDTDEANAANLATGASGFIDGIQTED